MLELKDICYTLPDGKEILKHIDLTVRDNEFMVITGPNGGGKSTLAKLIAGIVTPTSGQERILNIADEIVIIADGRVANKGSRDEIYPLLLSEETAAPCGCCKGGNCR